MMGEEIIIRIKNDIKGGRKSDYFVMEVEPIILCIKTSEGIEALTNLLYFCYSKRNFLFENNILASVGMIKMEAIDIENFRRSLDELEEKLGDIKTEKNWMLILKDWILVAREAGQKPESVVVLYRLLYLARTIFDLLKVVEEMKKLEKAIFN